jgi:hypothetical protein
MIENEQYEGLLVRYREDGNTLVLVLEDFQEGFPSELSEEVREIAITGVDTKFLDDCGLIKSQGNPFWITIKKGSVVLGSDFMPDHEHTMSNVTITKRPHDIPDLLELYLPAEICR